MSSRPVLLTIGLACLLGTGVLQSQSKPQTPPRRGQAKPAPAKPQPPAPTQAPRAPEPPPAADLKIVTTYTQGAQMFQNTTCIKGARQRVEFPGMVSLQQCDLNRNVMLNPDAKKYRVETGESRQALPPQPTQPAQVPGQPPAGGVITFTTTLTDTLERQTMFGREARRIKTVITKQTDGTACDKTPMRTEIDGWYVDLPQSSASCAKSGAQTEPPPAAGECRDRIESRVVGDVTLGFPVKAVTTTAW